MSKRSTFKVADLVEATNKQLARTDVTAEFRRGLASILEHVLFEAHQYHGYNHVYWTREGGYEAWTASGLEDGPYDWAVKAPYVFGTEDGTDNYRRCYY